jgi:single-strand DNA-binding protein
LSIATSQSWKDKSSGERKEKTEWHRVVIFNEGLVGVVQQYVKKGANVYVEGQLSTRKWKDEASGQDKYSTEIVLQGYNSSLTMLDSRNNGDNSGLVSEKKSSLPNDNLNQENSDLDDEIPF